MNLYLRHIIFFDIVLMVCAISAFFWLNCSVFCAVSFSIVIVSALFMLLFLTGRELKDYDILKGFSVFYMSLFLFTVLKELALIKQEFLGWILLVCFFLCLIGIKKALIGIYHNIYEQNPYQALTKFDFFIIGFLKWISKR